MTFQCWSSAAAATSAGLPPASIWSARWPNESAQMVQRTVLTSDTFCDEPTARNSKRCPPYGKGDVRFRSSAGIVKGAISSRPRSTVLTAGAYSLPALDLRNSSRYAVIVSPRYVEMMAGGASHAPSRKSLPGDAIAMRIKSPWRSMARTMPAISTGKISCEPDAFASWAGLRRFTPVLVPREMLLCLPEPLMSLKGFSCGRQARPCRAATSSQICITIRFWSICVTAVPKKGANSYWFGATSRWRVRRGMPSMKHSCWISCMHSSATGLMAAM
mmetsp:Transcript_12252/g.39414  ORF Transcript_12252/g.39414 Transcript_12252/m.39414 type:complete len:274 (+) Transcript_12252:807-1628(+)